MWIRVVVEDSQMLGVSFGLGHGACGCVGEGLRVEGASGRDML